MAVASAGSGSLSPDLSSAPSLPRSSATFGPVEQSRRRSTSSERDEVPETSVTGNTPNNPITSPNVVPDVNVNGAPLRSPKPAKTTPAVNGDIDEMTWGSNFWVTLVDPQVCASIVQLSSANIEW